MSNFTVRIELHGAARDDYETLHTRMEAGGYRRYMAGTAANGQSGYWKLPTAEYDHSSDRGADAVREHARGIANTVKPGAWCLVTEVAARSIYSDQL